MIKIDVVSECTLWSKKIKRNKTFFNSILKFFPKKYKFIGKKINLTILLSNNKNIKKLNKDFRNKNKPTDVLSFPFEKKFNPKKSNYLGDIVISYEFMNKPKNISKNIKKLNKDFRNKNKPTDVLSFPFEKKFNPKKSNYLGDIVISYEFMNKPKNISILEFKQKVVKIFIHGFLHLLGHDHIKLKDFKKMIKEEDLIYKFIKTKVA